MIGQSSQFLAAVRLIQRFAACDAPVLIEGETGTGKELAARAIHYAGCRRDKLFIPVNCGAIPENLIENELFGHASGAFTGARTAGPGLMQLADAGTLFLDEIDSLPERGQVALLRVLQDGRFRPLGARSEVSVNVRIIAASNRSLAALAASKEFRSDLLFRLRVLALEMPPLRQRHGDSLLLAEHFLCGYARRYEATPRKLNERTCAWFESYSWPGNVRELENLVHREFLLADGHEIDVSAPCTMSFPSFQQIPLRTKSAQEHVAYADARQQVLDEFDREYLTTLLRSTQGNVSHAARLAGKERSALGKLLRKHGISAAHFRS